MKYKNNHKGKLKLNTLLCFATMVVNFTALAVHSIIVHNHVDFQLKAYAPERAYAYSAPTPTPTPSEHDLIIAYIKQVFGNEAKNAFKILS